MEATLETGEQNHRHTPQALGNGRYELCEFISKGGMGAVYRARDVELDRSVAVKCLLDVAKENSRELAVKEARTLASLSHPNIMRVFDILSVGDQIWIVSEWLEGKCLAQLPLPLPPGCVLAIMAQIYDALAFAHAAQVIHRDVKPSNVMIGTSGRVSLIDFGVAFAPGSSTGDTVAGSLRYVDPRILEGETPDAQADLFSAALLQVELMTGETVLPDLAPLPLYRHIKKNLATRLELLLDGTYPPLAALPKELASLFTDVKRLTAKDAHLACLDALRKLTPKSPEQYLADTLCQGSVTDSVAEKLISAEAEAALADQAMSPREKASWIAFKAAAEAGPSPELRARRQAEYRSKHLTKAGRQELMRDHHHNLLAPLMKKVPSRFQRLVGSVSLPVVVLLGVFLWMKLAPSPDRTLKVVPPAATARPDLGATVELGPDQQVKVEPVVAPDKGSIGVVPSGGEVNQKILEKAPEQVAPAAEPPNAVAVNLVANAWAVVTIDGKEVGRLPQAAPFKVTPGRHALSLSSPTVEPLLADLVVEANKPLRLHYNLKPKVSQRVFKLAKPGRLFIDGKDHGVVTVKKMSMTYGTHQIQIQRGGKVVGKPRSIALGPDSPAEISLE